MGLGAIGSCGSFLNVSAPRPLINMVSTSGVGPLRRVHGDVKFCIVCLGSVGYTSRVGCNQGFCSFRRRALMFTTPKRIVNGSSAKRPFRPGN